MTSYAECKNRLGGLTRHRILVIKHKVQDLETRIALDRHQYAETADRELTVYKTFVERMRIVVELAANNTERRRVLALLVRKVELDRKQRLRTRGDFVWCAEGLKSHIAMLLPCVETIYFDRMSLNATKHNIATLPDTMT